MVTNALVDIIALGSVYALLALGYGLVFAVRGTFSPALPAAAVAAAFASSALQAAHHTWWFSLACGIIAAGLLGVVVDRAVLGFASGSSPRPLEANRPLIAGAAVWMLCAALAGDAAPHIPAPAWVVSTQLALGRVAAPDATIFAAFVSIVALSAVWLFVRATRFGLGLRAVAADEHAARAAGVGIDRLAAGTAFVAWSLAATAGVAAGIERAGSGRLSVDDALAAALGAIGAVLLGGRFGLPGAVGAAYAVAAVQVVLGSWEPGRAASVTSACAIALLATALLPRAPQPHRIDGAA